MTPNSVGQNISDTKGVMSVDQLNTGCSEISTAEEMFVSTAHRINLHMYVPTAVDPPQRQARVNHNAPSDGIFKLSLLYVKCRCAGRGLVMC